MTVAWQSKSAASQSSGVSVTISAPSGIANGDLLLLYVNSGGNVNITTPSGWTLITNDTTGNASSADAGAAIYWRIASSEPGSYTFTNLVDSATTIDVMMQRINGQDGSTPIHAFSHQTSNTGGTGGSWIAPSLTTSIDGCLLVYFAATRDSSTSGTPTTPSGFTKREDAAITFNWNEIATELQGSHGATGTVTAVLSGAPGTDKWAAQLVAVAPTAPAGMTVGISEASMPIMALRQTFFRRHSFRGWTAGPAAVDVISTGGPVSIYLDCPTIDKRHSQIVFQGFTCGVREDNDPTFVMPFPVTALPPIRAKRGHLFNGWTGDCQKFEYDMAAQWVEPMSPLWWKRRYDYKGYRQGVPTDKKPEEIFDTIHTALPPSGRLTIWQRQALFSGPMTPVGNNNFTPAVVQQKLPLIGVGV